MSALKAGKPIPEFTSVLQDGNVITSTELSKGKVILFFYPHDNTPTCTEEACNLRDHHADFLKQGYRVYGVSPDSIRKHQNFIKKYNLPYSLISDPDLELINKFGVWGPKKLFGREYDGVLRTTFILRDGIIKNVIDEVKAKSHAGQILNV
ncbi:MAG: peroxiredoxin [Saprospiraceae bacterium]|nr:peroxiredoxin [Saprospiraceae bacterium]